MANTSKGRFPSYGLVRGPSHADGGVPASVANGPDVELEGGEYIIPKEAVPDYLPVLQQITQVGRDRQQMQNGNSAIDALIASASMQNGIAQPKSPVYQEGGQVQSKTLRGSRVVSRDIGRDGDMFTGQVIMAIPADQVGEGDGLRYYLSEPRQSQSMSLLDRKAQSSARRKMAFAPQDSLPADLVEGYFDRQNKTSILDMDNEKSPLGFLKNLIGKEQGGMVQYEDGGEVHSRRMFNQGTGFDKKKSDLDGDGNISEYERKRGMAIAKAMGKMQMGGMVDGQPMMQRPMNPAMNFSPMQRMNPRMYQEGGQVDKGAYPAKDMEMLKQFPLTYKFFMDRRGQQSYYPEQDSLAARMFRGEIDPNEAFSKALMLPLTQEKGTAPPRRQQEIRNPNERFGPPRSLMGAGLSNFEKAEKEFEAFMDSLQTSRDINPFTGEPMDTDADVERLKRRMQQSKIPRSRQRVPMQDGGQVQLRKQAEKNTMSRQPKEKIDVIFPFLESMPRYLYPDFIGPRSPRQILEVEDLFDEMLRNAKGDKKYYIPDSDKEETGMKIAQEGGMVSNNNLMGSIASDQRIAPLQPDVYQSKSENGVTIEQRVEVPKLAEAILPIYGLETPLSKNQGSMLKRNNVTPNVLNPQVKGLINRVLVQRLAAEGS